MKLVRAGAAGQERPCVVDDRGVLRDVSSLVPDWRGSALGRESLEAVRRADWSRLPAIASDARIGACVAGTGHFLAIGLNYRDHAREVNMPVPVEPVVFSKASSSICGPNDPIVLPPGSTRTDWEAELAIVIGREAYRLPENAACEAIAGYCVCNDLSERAWQLEGTGQWIKGKSAPSFGPLGPWLVTPDEIEDVLQLRVWLEIDGQRIQDSSTREMVFSPTQIVAYLSRFMRLEPGDVITTGTPPGVGMGLKPPRFLAAGERVRLGVDGVGVQDHLVVATRPGEP